MIFSRICRDFTEPHQWNNIYIKSIANTFFSSIQTRHESISIFYKALLQQCITEQSSCQSERQLTCLQSLLSCSWKPSVLSDNFTAPFPLSSWPTGPFALDERAWTAWRDPRSPKCGCKKMPLVRALEKRDEKLSLRVPSWKQLVTGLVEDPGRVTSRQRSCTAFDFYQTRKAKHRSLQRNSASASWSHSTSSHDNTCLFSLFT